jgi:hypothetical protein
MCVCVCQFSVFHAHTHTHTHTRTQFHKDQEGQFVYDGVDGALKHASDYIAENGPYDGLLGFSQGAAFVSLLMGMLCTCVRAHVCVRVYVRSFLYIYILRRLSRVSEEQPSVAKQRIQRTLLSAHPAQVRDRVWRLRAEV